MTVQTDDWVPPLFAPTKQIEHFRVRIILKVCLQEVPHEPRMLIVRLVRLLPAVVGKVALA